MKTRITEMFNIKYPILQGAIQWLSKADFASAVSNAGGLGVITAASQPTKADLVKEIRKMRELTDKPFCVNISLLPKLTDTELTMDYLEAVIEEKVPIVETSGRNPVELIPELKKAGIKLIHKVPGVRYAKKAEEIGADAVTIVGYEGGGHPGLDYVSTFIVLPKTAETVKIPVLAAGGICDAKSFMAALALGADGVVMGTRLMLTRDTAIHEVVKNWLLSAKEMDTVLTQRSIRNPYRVMKNTTSNKVLEMEAAGSSLEELLPIISGKRGLQAMTEGDIEGAQISVGQVIGRINSLKTVKEVIEEIAGEVEAVLHKINNAVKQS